MKILPFYIGLLLITNAKNIDSAQGTTKNPTMDQCVAEDLVGNTVDNIIKAGDCYCYDSVSTTTRSIASKPSLHPNPVPVVPVLPEPVLRRSKQCPQGPGESPV